MLAVRPLPPLYPGGQPVAKRGLSSEEATVGWGTFAGVSMELDEAVDDDAAGPIDHTAMRATLPDPKFAYDYFKSMASVSVATLGGILTLGEAVFGSRIAPLQMGVAALPVAIAGMLALQGKTDVMQAVQGMKPLVNSSRLALRLVPSFYGLGVGIFLAFLSLSYIAPDVSARLGGRKGAAQESGRPSVGSPARVGETSRDGQR